MSLARPVVAVLLCAVALTFGAVSPTEAELVLDDPSSPVYYDFVLTAGGQITVNGSGQLTGDVHANAGVTLGRFTVVDGDVSAVGDIDSRGTVTGQTTSPAPAVTLPAMLDETQLEALADRSFKGDTPFHDAIIDDVVFVAGDVSITGSFDGVGTLLVGGSVDIAAQAGPQPMATGRLSILATGDVTLGGYRSFRGVVRAGGAVTFGADVDAEAVVVAGGIVSLGARTELTALALDTTSPTVELQAPVDGGWERSARPDVFLSFSDDLSGVAVSSIGAWLDGVELTALGPVELDVAGLKFVPTASLAEGAHELEIELADVAGNPVSGSYGFSVDSVAPHVTFTAPTSTTIYDPTPRVELTFDDVTSGVDTATLSVVLDRFTDLTSSCTVSAGAASCVLPTLSPGEHRLRVDLADLAGHVATATLAIERVLDDAPPSLEITTPSYDLLVNEPAPTIAVTFADAASGIDPSSFSLRSGAVDLTATCLVEATGATCSPPHLGGGLRPIEAQIRDAAGNLASAQRTFEVLIDDTPPLLAIESPTSPLVLGAVPSFEFSYSDAESGIAPTGLEVFIDSVEREDCDITPTYAVCPAPAGFGDGPHLVEVQVDNRARLGVRQRFEFVFDGDEVAPEISFVSPAAVLLAEPPLIVELAWLDDDLGVDPESLLFSVDGEALEADCESRPDGASCVLALAAGSYQLVASVADLAGNRSAAQTTVDLTFDADAPSVLVTSPPAETFLDAPPPIAAQLSDAQSGVDPSSVEVTLDFDPVAGCSVGATSVDCAMPADLGPGSHVLVVTAEDFAGNRTRSEVTFALALADRQPPELEILSPSAGAPWVGVPEIRLAYDDAASGVDASSLFVAVDEVDITATCSADASGAVCRPEALRAGPHGLRVELADLDGNIATAVLPFELELQLAVAIDAPVTGELTTAEAVAVSGTVAIGASSVRVGEVEATLDGAGGFVAEAVPLREGANVLTAVAASDLGGVGTATVTVVRDTLPPQVVIFSPRDGAVVTRQQVIVTGEINDPASSSSGVTPPAVRVGGVPATVEQRAFVVEDYLLQPGENVLRVEATDTAGNVGVAEVRVRFEAAASQRLEEIVGNGQEAPAGSELADPLVVRLVDFAGQPLAGRQVHFEVTRGNGEVRSFPEAGRRIAVRSDASGLARARFAVGDRSGRGNHEVTVTSPGLVGEVVFCASAGAAAPRRIKRIVGNNQTGAQVAIADAEAPYPLLTQVFDEVGNPVPDLDVTYTVIDGGGNLAGGGDSVVARTDSQGKASARFVLGPEPGTNNNLVEATVPGLTETGALFSFSGVAPTDGPTRLSGLVLDNQDRPVPGVTLHVGDSQAVSAADGRFTLEDVPVGFVHLDVDGTTTTRPGRWPKLAFEFTTVRGVENTVGMPIRLLPIDAAGGQIVGGPVDVTLPLDGVPGAEITIFADSVTFPDGSKVGEVTFTQVLADKVPMVAPLGSDFMLAWTIQPPGTLFDPPLRIAIPNLGAEPGTVVDMFSFDHDLGEFITAGTAAVSDDGLQLVSTPGQGISKAGWGGCVAPPPPDGDVCHPSLCTVCPPGATRPLPKCGQCQTCNGGACRAKSVDEVVVKANGGDGGEAEEVVVGVGRSVYFSARVESDCDGSYAWSFGDGVTAGEGSPTHVYTEEGLYTVELEVGCGGCPDNGSSVDELKVRVVELDLVIGGLPEETEAAPHEVEPGVFLILNDDDDDADEVADHEDVDTVAGEDDLVEAEIRVDSELSQGELRLEAVSGGSVIRLWTTATKGEELELPTVWDLAGNDDVPSSVWVEAVDSSGGLRDVELVLSYTSEGLADPLEDRVLLTAVDLELVLAPAGDYEIPADEASVSLVAGVYYRDFEDQDKLIAVEDGAEVSFEVVEGGGGSVSPGTVSTEDGVAAATLSTGSSPGPVFRVAATVEHFKLEGATSDDPRIETGRRAKSAEMEVVPGPPSSILLTQSRQSYAADGTDTVSITAEVRDAVGNPVDDGTPISWLLGASQSRFESEDGLTLGGFASAVLRAPSRAEAQRVTVRVGALEQTATVVASRVTGSLAASVSELDILSGETSILTLTSDGVDGTPVFWATSNGSISGGTTLVGGSATATLSAVGGGTGDVVVTATVADRFLVWEGHFVTEGAEVQLIPERRFLVDEATEDGVETITWMNGTVRTVPVFATSQVEVRGPAGGTARIGLGGTGGPRTIEAHTFESAPGGVVPGLVNGLDLILEGAELDATVARTGAASVRFEAGDTGRLADSPLLDFPTGLGVSLWLRPAQMAAGDLIEHGDSWSLEMQADGSILARAAGPGGPVEVSSQPLVAGAWNFVSLEVVPGLMTLDVNNVLWQVTFGGAPQEADVDVVLGGGLEAWLDDLKLFVPGGEPAPLRLIGLDAAGLVQLDDAGRGFIEVRSAGLPADALATPYFLEVDLIGGAPETLTSASLRLSQEKSYPGAGPACYSIYIVKKEYWVLAQDVVISFVGGDPQTNAGMVANIAGGILVIGDLGSLAKNLWRKLGFSDEPVNNAEVILSSLGLLTEIAVLFGEAADIPISAARGVVLRIGDSPFADLLANRIKRLVTKGEVPDEVEKGFLNLLKDNPDLLQGLSKSLKNEDLYEAALTICKRSGGAALLADRLPEKGPGAHRVILDQIGVADEVAGEWALTALNRFDELAPAGADSALARLAQASDARIQVAVEALTGLTSKLDPDVLARAINNRALLSPNYDEALYLAQLGKVTEAERLSTLVGRMTTPIPPFAKGWRYELEVAVALQDLLGKRATFFDKLAGRTDIDVVLGDIAVQAKSTWLSLVGFANGKPDVTVGVASATRWIQTALDLPEVGGDITKVLYAMPPSVKNSIPPEIMDVFRKFDLPSENIMAIEFLKRALAEVKAAETARGPSTGPPMRRAPELADFLAPSAHPSAYLAVRPADLEVAR